jgi:hypothetical protein
MQAFAPSLNLNIKDMKKLIAGSLVALPSARRGGAGHDQVIGGFDRSICLCVLAAG